MGSFQKYLISSLGALKKKKKQLEKDFFVCWKYAIKSAVLTVSCHDQKQAGKKLYHHYQQHNKTGHELKSSLPSNKHDSNETGNCGLLTLSKCFLPALQFLTSGETAENTTSHVFWTSRYIKTYPRQDFFFAQQAVQNANLLLCQKSQPGSNVIKYSFFFFTGILFYGGAKSSASEREVQRQTHIPYSLPLPYHVPVREITKTRELMSNFQTPNLFVLGLCFCGSTKYMRCPLVLYKLSVLIYEVVI